MMDFSKQEIYILQRHGELLDEAKKVQFENQALRGAGAAVRKARNVLQMAWQVVLAVVCSVIYGRVS